MGGLFGGLEAFGLEKLSNVEVYEKADQEKENDSSKENTVAKAREADLVFDKTFTCPVCDREFKSKTVKTGKVKLIAMDTDLRPKYQLMDSLKYDAIVCPNCGYAALNRFFNYMTGAQAKLVISSISNSFRGLPADGEIYTYDDAISRHKLALLNTIVKKSKLSEKAYTCLKTAWLLRGKAETLPVDTPEYAKVRKNLQTEEDEFIKNAYEGFVEAFSKELFPMCGMDENTCTYLVADLARRCGKTEDACRWISKVLTARDANARIKSKACEIKELIKADKQKK
jgi:uncharacterized protein